MKCGNGFKGKFCNKCGTPTSVPHDEQEITYTKTETCDETSVDIPKVIILKFLIALLIICALVLVGKVAYTFVDGNGLIPDKFFAKLTASEIVDLIKYDIDSIDRKIVYTQQTDVNSLLGVQNQYTSKVEFTDIRIKQYDANNPLGGSVEVFDNTHDAMRRKKYIQSVLDKLPDFMQYIYQRDNVLLRIDNSLTSSQAKEYENSFLSLNNQSQSKVVELQDGT